MNQHMLDIRHGMKQSIREPNVVIDDTRRQHRETQVLGLGLVRAKVSVRVSLKVQSTQN